MAEKHNPTFRGNLHKGTADKFKALAIDLENSDRILDVPSPSRAQKPPLQLSLSIGDLEGLPPELIQELSLSDADKTEFEIVSAIEEAGSVISLDRLLIALYKRTGEIHKRSSLYSRLARLVQKNLIYYVPGKKGTYSTEQMTPDDVTRVFGGASTSAAKQDSEPDA